MARKCHQLYPAQSTKVKSWTVLKSHLSSDWRRTQSPLLLASVETVKGNKDGLEMSQFSLRFIKKARTTVHMVKVNLQPRLSYANNHAFGLSRWSVPTLSQWHFCINCQCLSVPDHKTTLLLKVFQGIQGAFQGLCLKARYFYNWHKVLYNFISLLPNFAITLALITYFQIFKKKQCG